MIYGYNSLETFFDRRGREKAFNGIQLELNDDMLNWKKLTSLFGAGRGFSDFNELLSLCLCLLPRHRIQIFFLLKKRQNEERIEKKRGGEAGSGHLDLSAPLSKASVSFNFSEKIQYPPHSIPSLHSLYILKTLVTWKHDLFLRQSLR